MSDNLTVAFENVYYSYNRKKPYRDYKLSNITFSAYSGDVIGIIGHNGAGKSSLVKLIAGITQPNSGIITTNGKVSTLLSLNSGQILNLTGRENIIITGLLMGLTKAEITKKLDEIIVFSQLEPFIDKPIKTYSSGMKARLSFSTLVHIDAEILLLDEIFSVGDAEFKVRAEQKMRENIFASNTTFIVSHNMDFIRSICNKVMLIDQGTLVEFSDPNQVLATYIRLVDEKLSEESTAAIS